MELKNKKITLATLKSFIKKSEDLLIKNISSFDSMQDCISHYDNSDFRNLSLSSEMPFENSLGFQGIWLVGSSRDHFYYYNDNEIEGIKVNNCCGSFVIGKVLHETKQRDKMNKYTVKGKDESEEKFLFRTDLKAWGKFKMAEHIKDIKFYMSQGIDTDKAYSMVCNASCLGVSYKDQIKKEIGLI